VHEIEYEDANWIRLAEVWISFQYMIYIAVYYLSVKHFFLLRDKSLQGPQEGLTRVVRPESVVIFLKSYFYV
jgi:hypothetical protein